MFRDCTFEKVEAVESPATGDTRWLCDAAAAMGTENKDRLRGEEALRKIDANTLAACAKVRVSRARCGSGRVGRVRDGGMRCGRLTAECERCGWCLM
jgi:hypothetical protein